MNVKGFFVAALSSALDLGVATHDDLVRHVTPEVLATHLPRPLWARLLTACLGAPRVDAQLVIDTIGLPNLCEHVPTPIIWACLEELGARALGATVMPKVPPALTIPAKTAKPSLSITAPPAINQPPAAATQKTPIVGAPEIPSLNVSDPFEEDRPTGPANRPRSPTGQRFRASSTGIGRLANTNNINPRRPQASAAATPPEPPPAHGTGRTGRASSESEYEVLTDVSGRGNNNDDWKSALAVEDEQLVDWSNSEETVTNTGGNAEEFPRKRDR